MRQVYDQISKQRERVANLNQLTQHVGQTEIGAEADLTATIEAHDRRLLRLEAEVQRRLSNGFSCFCFAILGIPLAIWRRDGDYVTVFFVCFLPILIGFYPSLVMGEYLAVNGLAPPYAVWLGCAVFLVLGVTGLWRVCRY